MLSGFIQNSAQASLATIDLVFDVEIGWAAHSERDCHEFIRAKGPPGRSRRRSDHELSHDRAFGHPPVDDRAMVGNSSDRKLLISWVQRGKNLHQYLVCLTELFMAVGMPSHGVKGKTVCVMYKMGKFKAGMELVDGG